MNDKPPPPEPGSDHEPDNPLDKARQHAVDGLLREMARSGQGDDETFVQRVMTSIHEPGTLEPALPPAPVEPAWTWYGSRRFWRFAAAACAACLVTVALLGLAVSSATADPTELFLYGQPDLAPGGTAAFRVYMRDADQGEAVEGATVRVTLKAENGRTLSLGKTTTDDQGFALAQAQLPADLPAGDYEINVVARSAAGASTLSRQVSVQRSFRTMLTTDKPLYQPGQTIHLRALALGVDSLKPAVERPVIFEVLDSKGNKVFRKKASTSRFGIASADFVLADQVNTGSYTVRATADDTVSEREVEVRRYQLPKYAVTLTTDKPYYAPGEVLAGEVRATYTFGEPVAGARVTAVAETFVERFRPFADVDGTTDSDGAFRFELTLPDHFVGQDLKRGDAIAALNVRVVDPAGHQQEKTTRVTVTTRPIRIEVFPESGMLAQGVENTVYIVTAYADGRPARTTLHIGDHPEPVETSALGIAKIKITPRRQQLQLTVQAEDADGLRSRSARKLRVDERTEGFLLRTDKVVYRQGETVNATLLSTTPRTRMFVDVVKEGRSLIMQSVDIENGRGGLALDLPRDVAGTLELHAYRIFPGGEIAEDVQLIQVNLADDLAISVSLDQETYRPAEQAILRFAVTGRDGDPIQAALSLSAVDEAVFALSSTRPGLEALYFLLQEDLLTPRYQLNAEPPVAPTDLIRERPPEPAWQEAEWEEAEVVLFSAAEGESPPRIDRAVSFADKQQEVEADKAVFGQRVRLAAYLLPFFLFALLSVPFTVYALLKVVRRKPLAGLEEDEQRQFGRGTRSLFLLCLAGFYLPPLCLLGSVLLIEALGSDLAVVLVSALLIGPALVILVLMSGTTARFRALPSSLQTPLFRKLTATLPAWYLLAWLGLVGLIVALEDYDLGLDEGLGAALLIAALLLIFLVPAVVALGRACALRPISAGGAIWVLSSRFLGGFLPLFLVLVVGLFGRQVKGVFSGMGSSLGGADAAEFGGFEDGLMREAMASFDDSPQDGRRASAVPGQVEESLPARAAPPRVRTYFPETLYWQPELITDDAGRATLELPLADSITTWRLAAGAVAGDGRLGSSTTGIRVFQDFFIDIDFPVALTQHDEVAVPIAVYNYLDETQSVRVEVETADWFDLLDEPVRVVEIEGGGVTAVRFRLKAQRPGVHALKVTGTGSALADAVQRTVQVEPDGRLVEQTINGRMAAGITETIAIPDRAIDGASDLFVKIYPGAFSQVLEGMDSIFRMPHGCFEQTSSTTYPNVLVLDYLRRTKRSRPEIEMKALNYIGIGYQRLLSFEVDGGGFDWFGNPPAHTVLTAYGLMEFADMADVFEVDPAVIERTRTWLLQQREGDGSWQLTGGKMARSAVHMQTSGERRVTAYVAWAVAEAGGDLRPLNPSFAVILGGIDQETDPYTLALCANALIAGEQTADAERLLERLLTMATEEDQLVHWESETEGVMYGRGRSLGVETTALAAYALLRAEHAIPVAHKALAWLTENKDGRGTWYSTQATVLAMRALLAGTDGAAAVKEPVEIGITANGEEVRRLSISEENADVFHLVSLRDQVRRGANRVDLAASGEANIAYQVVARHYVPWEDAPPETGRGAEPLTIDVAYDTNRLKPEDLLTATVTLRYNRPEPASMTLVDLGLPPGFAVQREDFERLRKAGTIERFTITGRQVTLYFRTLEAGRDVVFRYGMKAKYPLRAQAPQSVAYQYYEPEVRAVSAPALITVE